MKLRNLILSISFALLLVSAVIIGLFAEDSKVQSKALILNSSEKKSPAIVVEQKGGVVVEKPTETRIRFFGDMMLDRNVASKMGEQGLKYIFAKVSSSPDFFENKNLLIANLEGPFADKRIATSKSIAFRFDPKYAKQLKGYGFDAFNLANNHSYDMGRQNVAFTRSILKENDIGYFGDELGEGPVYTFVTTTETGIKFAFLGLHNTYHTLNLEKVSEAIVSVGSSTDYIVVNVHWGEEYKSESNKKQRELAHWLIENGADAIIGHHPHVIQEFEIYRGKPIFYSLGNFIFDQYFSTSTQTGLGATLVFSEGKMKQIEITPFVGIKSQINFMPENEKIIMENWLNTKSRLGDKKIVDWKIIF